MKPTFANPGLPATGTVVVSVLDGGKLSASAQALDKKMQGGLRRAIKASRFKGSKGHSMHLMAPAGTKLDRVLLVGLGKPTDITATAMQDLGGRIYSGLATKGQKLAHVLIDGVDKAKVTPAVMSAELAFGARLASYRFDKYRTQEKPHDKPTLKTLKIASSGSAQARKLYQDMDKVADGVFFTRDLVSEPSNVLYPETLAKEAKKLVKLGVKVEVLGETRLQKLGMGALLGVGHGSVHESKLVVMQWNGAPKSKDKPIAFVGKGVTFDTGGISIKPSGGMEDMKWDMAGSGVVIGLMKALAGRKAKVNV
ncbi:MAG: leucyl aminopeptidase family protein, partial [Alphaproteobacteria bacterium]